MARKRAAAKPRSSQGNFRSGFDSVFGGTGQRRAAIKSVGVKRRGPAKGASDSEAALSKKRSGARQRRRELGVQGARLPLSQFGG